MKFADLLPKFTASSAPGRTPGIALKKESYAEEEEDDYQEEEKGSVRGNQEEESVRVQDKQMQGNEAQKVEPEKEITEPQKVQEQKSRESNKIRKLKMPGGFITFP